MPLIRHLLVALAVLATAIQPAALAQDSGPAVQARIGGVEMQFPIPDGFSDPSTRLPRLRTVGEAMTPQTNRLLAFLVSDTDLDAIAQGRPPALGRYVLVQTLRATENIVVSDQDMVQLKKIMREQQAALLKKLQPTIDSEMARASRTLGDQMGRSDLSIKVGEMVPVEIFDERRDSISTLALSKVAVKTDTINQERMVTIAMTTARMRGKIVYFYVAAQSDSSADMDWAKRTTKAWLDSVR